MHWLLLVRSLCAIHYRPYDAWCKKYAGGAHHASAWKTMDPFIRGVVVVTSEEISIVMLGTMQLAFDRLPSSPNSEECVLL
jgi:hypothetical protein